MIKGTGVSSGVGIAQAILWHTGIEFDYIPRKTANPEEELARFEAARTRLMGKTGDLRKKTARIYGAEEAIIFDAYRQILDDEEILLVPLREKISRQSFTAEYAVATQFNEIARQFMRLEDDYMRQRVDDIFALRDQMMRELVGLQPDDISHLDRPTVLVAAALSPTDVAGLDISRLEGIICETGGYSSHMSIIARNLGIPAVVAAEGATNVLRSGDLVALDGETGEIWVNPCEEEIAALRGRGEAFARQQARSQQFRGLPTISRDGRRVELSANVGWLGEVGPALDADAESIGLFRTELLHTSTGSLPDEEEQFHFYRRLLQGMRGKAVTVRTFDDGGRRNQVLLKKKPEHNPVLGYRGVRMSLGRPSFFRAQLRALLRASAYGSMRIMFPMVVTLDELDSVLAALDAVKAELRREQLPFDKDVPVGVYVEVPSAALISSAIAARVDFLSIGINDLVQFTLAVDRDNPDLGHLYKQFHPSVMRLIAQTVDAAHSHGISCNICGEIPGQERILPLLLGLGLDGFSTDPAHILLFRQVLNQCNYADCQRLAEELMPIDSADELTRRLTELYNANMEGAG